MTNIKTCQLFAVAPGPEDAMERLHLSIVKDIEQMAGEAVRKAIIENGKMKRAKIQVEAYSFIFSN